MANETSQPDAGEKHGERDQVDHAPCWRIVIAAQGRDHPAAEIDAGEEAMQIVEPHRGLGLTERHLQDVPPNSAIAARTKRQIWTGALGDGHVGLGLRVEARVGRAKRSVPATAAANEFAAQQFYKFNWRGHRQGATLALRLLQLRRRLPQLTRNVSDSSDVPNIIAKLIQPSIDVLGVSAFSLTVARGEYSRLDRPSSLR